MVERRGGEGEARFGIGRVAGIGAVLGAIALLGLAVAPPSEPAAGVDAEPSFVPPKASNPPPRHTSLRQKADRPAPQDRVEPPSAPRVRSAAGAPRRVSRTPIAPLEIAGASPESQRRLVERSSDADEAQAAAWSIGNRGRPSDEDVDAILDRLGRIRPGEERLLCTLLWVLSGAPDRIPFGRVAELARSHAVADVRRQAIDTLFAAGDGGACAEILAAVAREDEDASNRAKGAFLLDLVADGAVAAELALEALRRETDPEVRRTWASMSALATTPAGRDLLEAIALDGGEPEPVRREALGRLGSVDEGRAGELARRTGLGR